MAPAWRRSGIRVSTDSGLGRSQNFSRTVSRDLSDPAETPLETAVEGRTREVQPFGDRLMAARAADVVFEQELAGLGVAGIAGRRQGPDRRHQPLPPLLGQSV